MIFDDPSVVWALLQFDSYVKRWFMRGGMMTTTMKTMLNMMMLTMPHAAQRCRPWFCHRSSSFMSLVQHALTVESETTNDMLQSKASNEHVHKYSGTWTVLFWCISGNTSSLELRNISHVHLCPCAAEHPAPEWSNVATSSSASSSHSTTRSPLWKSTIGSHVAAPQDDSPSLKVLPWLPWSHHSS